MNGRETHRYLSPIGPIHTAPGRGPYRYYDTAGPPGKSRKRKMAEPFCTPPRPARF